MGRRVLGISGAFTNSEARAMRKIKVAIFGASHACDYPDGWDVRQCTPLGELSRLVGEPALKTHLTDIFKKLDGVDVAIYALAGQPPSRVMPRLLTDPSAREIFEIPRRRALWSVDSHHWAGQEHEWASHFTSVYSSDPWSLGIDAVFLPPAIWGVSAKALKELPLPDYPAPYSVCCLMRPYGDHKTDRGSKMAEIVKLFRKYGTSFIYGTVEPYPAYLTAIRNSHIGLNLSLRGELNARAFEVLAMNRILLTNRFKRDEMNGYFPPHVMENVLFFDGLHDFDWVFQQAIIKPSSNTTRDWVADEHCLAHRYMYIAGNEANDKLPVA